MTAPMLMTDCPTDETLAAYVDDRLDAATRLKVTEHLATCGDCRELVMMASDFQAETEMPAPEPVVDPDSLAVTRLDPTTVVVESSTELAVVNPNAFAVTRAGLNDNGVLPANVVRGRFRWIAAAAGFAAAAVVPVFLLRPVSVFGPDMQAVIAASGRLDRRPSEGRLAGFPHLDAPQTLRGAGDSLETDQLVKKADLYQVRLYVEDATLPDRHVDGVTQLLIATDRTEFNQAAETLTVALNRSFRRDRDTIATDLATALIARGRWQSNPQADFQRALDLSTEVFIRSRMPEAAWNRAVALEKLQRNVEAIHAWDDYLKLDATSEWANEAVRRSQRLKDDEAAMQQEEIKEPN